MECIICLEQYDREARLPKNLPCGHTACLQCLQRCERTQCTTCRQSYNRSAASLPNAFALLDLMDRQSQDSARSARGWCSDCRAAASDRCRDEHEVLSAKAALRRHLPAGVLQPAAVQLEALQRQVQEEAALRALVLMSTPSWDISLRAGGLEMRGAVENSEDPLVKAVWLVLVASAGLTECTAGNRVPLRVGDGPSAAANPAPAAASTPPAATIPAPAAAEPPPAAAPLTRELDLKGVYNRGAAAMAAALRDAEGVTRLVGVWCDTDPAWSLQLLQRAAPTLERLEVDHPDEDHLRCIHSMPRLRRLQVAAPRLPDRPLELPALPPGHSALRWLWVHLPRAPLQSLLRAHAGTLEELWLQVGMPGEWQWPDSCSDLHVLLEQCGLRAVRRIVLRRGWCVHTAAAALAACRKQRRAVRRALPGLQEVLCSRCDGVAEEV